MSKVVIALLAALAGAAFVGGIAMVIDQRSGPDIVISGIEVSESVTAYVDGAVLTPGLYDLGPDARVADAIAAAGGLAPDADLTMLNPASRLRDGDRVTIPRTGDLASRDNQSVANTDSLDLNTATLGELVDLPGIGEVLAERIVAHRDANGPFASVDDLLLVEGISPTDLEALRPLLSTAP